MSFVVPPERWGRPHRRQRSPHAASLGHGGNRKHPQEEKEESSAGAGVQPLPRSAARGPSPLPRAVTSRSTPRLPRGVGPSWRGGGSAPWPPHAGTTASHRACLRLLPTQCRFSEVEPFIDTLPPFELHYIYFLFFFLPLFFFFFNKKNSCSY